MFERMVDIGVVQGLRAVAEHLRSVGAHSPGRVVDLGELCRRGNVVFEVLSVAAAVLRALAREAEVAGPAGPGGRIRGAGGDRAAGGRVAVDHPARGQTGHAPLSRTWRRT